MNELRPFQVPSRRERKLKAMPSAETSVRPTRPIFASRLTCGTISDAGGLISSQPSRSRLHSSASHFDVASILAARLRVQSLDLIAQSVEIVELALSLGAVLRPGIGRALGVVLAVLVLLVAVVPRAATGGRAFGIGHLAV